ncbi:MAG: HU family DNA-binding protein [Azoarcus sp.]|jgi:predicted histone-like DNA-binding protein|nr:HU family DNA-binding protein [Azoarcus sp.]
MSIALRKIQRANPLNREDKKWYLSQTSKGRVDTDQICQDILELSSLSPGDVRSVLESLNIVIQKRLDSGYSVRLDKLGTFRASVTSAGAAAPEDLSVRNVKQVRLVFIPAPQLKESLTKARLEIEA